MKKIWLLSISLSISCVSDASEMIHDMVPKSTCELAADKIVASLPVQEQKKISSTILARRLEQIVPRRVENQTLIEQVIFLDSPLESTGTGLLLLQVNNEIETALQNQRVHDMVVTDCSIFAVLISVLAVLVKGS